MSFIPRTAWIVWVISCWLRRALLRLARRRSARLPDRFAAGGTRGRAGAVMAVDVVVDQLLEFLRDALALERHGLHAVDEHRGHRRFAGTRQADADVGVLALPR